MVIFEGKIWSLSQKSAFICVPFRFLAEGVGFEPTSPFGETVFKTAAIDHSAISPRVEIIAHSKKLCSFFVDRDGFS